MNHNLDVCALTETWLDVEDTVTPGLIPPPGYGFLSSPRTTWPGGEVGVIFKKDLSITVLKTHVFNHWNVLNTLLKRTVPVLS